MQAPAAGNVHAKLVAAFTLITCQMLRRWISCTSRLKDSIVLFVPSHPGAGGRRNMPAGIPGNKVVVPHFRSPALGSSAAISSPTGGVATLADTGLPATTLILLLPTVRTSGTYR